MKHLHWEIPQKRTVIPQQLVQAGCSPLLAAILHSRGMTSPEQAKDFLSCPAESMLDPYLLPDMDKAVRRINQAIENNEYVAVYGDYDVDGITSSCLMTSYLKSRGLKCDLYIPDRIEEGYGLNICAVQTLRSRGVSLIITVDCGVTAVKEADFARTIGVDMIITDHHQCQEQLPNAVAVVDGKRPDSIYPSPDSLAGVGVAFKVICALEGDSAGVLDRYGDLVAIGTIADIMPMLGENRYIIRKGLEKLRTSPSPGLKALIKAAGVEGKLNTASTIGFSLSPRLNAAGRLGRVDKAVDLLLTGAQPRADELAEELCAMNRHRQALERAAWEQAVDELGGSVPAEPIVLASESWHQGVIGIAASRLAERYNVPTVMICFDGDSGKGSCRSVPGFNLFQALTACSSHLESFGGHALAAGLNINRKQFSDFKSALTEYYLTHPPTEPEASCAELCIDRPEMLEMDSVESLLALEPCGNGNPRPVVCVTDALLENIIPMGGGRSLRLSIRKFGRSYEAVFFSRTTAELGLSPGDRVDVVFGPQINEYRGRRSVQLMVNDIFKHDPLPLCRRLLAGENPMSHELWELIPTRSDFAALWRRLKAMGGYFETTPENFLAETALPIHPAKICVCLLVLDELGLLRVNFSCGILEILPLGVTKKVDLNSSRLIHRLLEDRPGYSKRG